MDAAAFNRLVPGANDSNPFEDMPWYAAAYDATQNGVRAFCDDMHQRHAEDGGPCSAKQYGYLCGLIDQIVEQETGAADGHKRVLPVLVQRPVSADNPPSAKMVGNLLSQLATQAMHEGKKVENPDYSKLTVAACIAVYRAAEAVATPTLFDEAAAA